MFIKNNKMETLSYETLKKSANNIGYTIIEFNSIINDGNAKIIIDNLKLGDIILQSRGFTYADKNHRLIFINEELAEREKLMVLAHELGHIECEHFTTNPIIGNDVKEEYEANEFAHYLLNQNLIQKIKNMFYVRKKLMISLCVVLLLCAVAFCIVSVIKKEQSYYGNYYITSTGNKYHEKDCIFVKEKTSARRITKEEFYSGKYESCNTCLPE